MSPFLRYQLQASVNRSDRRAVIEDWEPRGYRARCAHEAYELRHYYQFGPGSAGNGDIYPDEDDGWFAPRSVDYSRW